jgi:hypothetical protein
MLSLLIRILANAVHSTILHEEIILNVSWQQWRNFIKITLAGIQDRHLICYALLGYHYKCDFVTFDTTYNTEQITVSNNRFSSQVYWGLMSGKEWQQTSDLIFIYKPWDVCVTTHYIMITKHGPRLSNYKTILITRMSRSRWSSNHWRHIKE